MRNGKLLFEQNPIKVMNYLQVCCMEDAFLKLCQIESKKYSEDGNKTFSKEIVNHPDLKNHRNSENHSANHSNFNKTSNNNEMNFFGMKKLINRNSSRVCSSQVYKTHNRRIKFLNKYNKRGWIIKTHISALINKDFIQMRRNIA